MLRGSGVDCVVLERDAVPSGSTALSSGFIPAAGTRVQRSRGIDDSAERFAGDIQAKAHGTAAPHLVAAYAQAIGPALDALEQRHGLQFELLEGFLYPGHSALRMHAVPQRTGAALMSGLRRAADAAGIPVIAQALVRELWVDDQGRALGLGYLRPDGAIEQVRLRRGAAGLQRLRRQPRTGARAVARRWPTPSSRATRATTAAPLPGAGRSAPAWPIWAATRATAPGRCRKAR